MTFNLDDLAPRSGPTAREVDELLRGVVDVVAVRMRDLELERQRRIDPEGIQVADTPRTAAHQALTAIAELLAGDDRDLARMVALSLGIGIL
jgi:hypothetical protein